MSAPVPFDYFAGHLISLNVELPDGSTGHFLFDTGIGLTIISTSLGERLGCSKTGETFSGQRMSGQSIRVPLVLMGPVTIGSTPVELGRVGTFDLSPFSWSGISPDGILSLHPFERTPLLVRYHEQNLVLLDSGQDVDSSRPRADVGVDVVRHGPSTEMFMDLALPSGSVARVEIDSGSDNLILHQRYMDELGANPASAGVTRSEGKDETGQPFCRYRTRLRGSVRPRGHPDYSQERPEVIFQEIIHDGLVGQDFLRGFDVTFDVLRSRVQLSRPGPPSPGPPPDPGAERPRPRSSVED